MKNDSVIEVLKPLTQAAHPNIKIGVDSKGLAVNLNNLNSQGAGEPIKDRDLAEKQTAFAFRFRDWHRPDFVTTNVPVLNRQVTEIRNLSLVSKKAGEDGSDSLHREVKMEVVGNGDKGRLLAEKLQNKRFPRDHADSAKVPNDNIRIWGDFRRAFGSQNGFEDRGLKGKIEPTLLIFLEHVFGKLSQKTGICHLIKNITNVIGNILGVEGDGNGFITPVDVTNWGDTARIDLILNGYFTLVERINLDKEGSIIPRSESFWQLFLVAETAYLDPDTGFYNSNVRALYALAWKELERAWRIIRDLKLVSNLDGVVTASFNLDEATEKRVREGFLLKYRAIYEKAQKKGVKDPVAGPQDVVKHPNGQVSHTVARYPELDGRSHAEKQFRLPSHWKDVIKPETEDEYRIRLYSTHGIVRRSLHWDSGFLFSVPEFKGMFTKGIEEKIERVASPPTLPHGGLSAEKAAVFAGYDNEQLANLNDTELANYTRNLLPKKPKINPAIYRRLELLMKDLPKDEEVKSKKDSELSVPSEVKIAQSPRDKREDTSSGIGGRFRRFIDRPLIGEIHLRDLR